MTLTSVPLSSVNQRTPVSIWRRHERLLFPLLIFALLRLVTGVTAFVVASSTTIEPPDWIYLNASGASYTLTLPPSAPLYTLTLPWHRYDTLWYTKDALEGYRDDAGIVFLPFYVALISMTSRLTAGNYVLASLIVSNIACALTFVLLYRLVIEEFGDPGLAKRTLICLAAFPTAYYLVAGYTESLFLALTLGAFLLARRKHWWLAGLMSCLAALTRLQGIILCLPLAWIALRQYPGWRTALARLPAILGALVGTGLYDLMLLVYHLGSPEQFYASEWHSETVLPWVSISRFVTRWLAGRSLYYEGDDAIILLVFVALSLIVFWKFKPYLRLYVGATILVLLLRGYDPAYAQLESMFRYVLLLFPCFIVLALLLKRRVLLIGYVLIGVFWQCLLLSRFVQWIWVA